MKWYSLSTKERVLKWLSIVLLAYVLIELFRTGKIHWYLTYFAVFFGELIWPFHLLWSPAKSYSMFLHPKKSTRILLWFMSIFSIVMTIFIFYYLIPNFSERNYLFGLFLSLFIGNTFGLIRFWPRYKMARSGN